jgi:hypothetical protein
MKPKIDFNYKLEASENESRYQRLRSDLEGKRILAEYISTLDFSSEVEFHFGMFSSMDTFSLRFEPVGDLTENEYRKLIAEVSLAFRVTLKREFQTFNGKFNWTGHRYGLENLLDEKIFIFVTLTDAPVQNCRIYKVKEMREVEVYKSECQEETANAN